MAAQDQGGDGRGAGIDPRTAALGAEAGLLPLPVGTVLERGFVIRSVLGRGGFGVTYMAEHTGIGRRVALKEHFPEQFAIRQGLSVRPTSAGSQMFKWGLDRFLDEARRLGQFKHPSIVDVTDVFEANGTAYMALAYEDGETLGKWLERLGRPPTQAELDRIVAPILDALEHVHGHDILHRDIAPDNIMLRRDGTPALIDFGAARQAMAERSQTLTGIVKHGYSPPEQYTRSSARHGPWSDIYALGATLYRAITGASPQEAPDRQIDDALAPLDALAAKGYRPAFLAALAQALALKPAERPQSVAAWRAALLQSPPKSEQRTAPAPPKPTPPPSGLIIEPPPRRSNVARYVGVAALVALVAVGAYVAGQRAGLSGSPRTEIATLTPGPGSRPKSPADGLDSALTVTPGSGQSFRDCPTCPEMVVVPAGRFTMGSPENEPERSSVEGPQLQVTIGQPFAVGKFEVRFAEWDACRAEGGCTHNPGDEGWGRGNRPVINVSWDDITKEYLPWLSRKTGKTYRLLSEAEWEYAARAGTTTPFWWGYSITPTQANYDGTAEPYNGGGAKGVYRKQTVPVDTFAANAWGLHNVHGNVWEWVEDCYTDSYNGAPSDGSARKTACAESSPVVRGGSWSGIPWLLRSAIRSRGTAGSRGSGLGFRVGRTL